jgi:uncharacterized repeat protein (TIGR03803 family)
MNKALLVVAALLAAAAPAVAGETVLYSFADGTDGGGPSGNLTVAGGDLYGTAHFGGITTCGGFVGGGCGVVYRLTPAQGGWTEQALYAFGDGTDGGFPNAGVVVDNSGNVYGAASTGGNTACSIGCGVVYEVSPHGSAWSERVLHAFDGTDGEFPNAPLWVDPAGNFYSTTWHGGASGSGEVFALKHSGSTWNETVLHAFNGTTEGLGPAGGVVLTPSGRIFGTTYVYNGQTDGTVYELVRAHRAWHDDVLQTFQGSANGCNPYAGLIADARGNLYGTTIECGPNGDGVAFEMVRAGKGYHERVLHTFGGPGDGASPYAGLSADARGNLYGTTVSGGASGSGTVYELAHTKRGYVEHILYSFGGGADGANAGGGVILDSSGDLFGVTSGGGASGAGTVYEITP